MASGISNTLTIGSGRGEIFGAWKGLGVEQQGHPLGRMTQAGNPIWIKIRQYNCRMLVRIMKALERAGRQRHNDGQYVDRLHQQQRRQATHQRRHLAVYLLGDCGGAFKTGRFTQLDGKRRINAIYATLLRVAGQNVDRFNMSEQMARKFDVDAGPSRRCSHDAGRYRSGRDPLDASALPGGVRVGLLVRGLRSNLYARSDDRQDVRRFARPFLVKYCVGCHGKTEPEGNLSLHDLGLWMKSTPPSGGMSGPRSR